MSNSKLLMFFSCWFISLTANSQVKKPLPQTKVPVQIDSLREKGSLDPQDYKYYFLARRGITGTANGTYTLKDRPSPSNLLTTPLVLIDARNMKELTWWPEIEALIKKDGIYGYSLGRQAPLLTKYSTNGKFIFSKYLTWRTPTGEDAQAMKSSDDKQVFAIYNNDAWVGDFDLSTGSISNMHQVTQSGVMSAKYYGYLRNNILLLDGHIINTKDGTFLNANIPYSNILSDTCHFYHMPIKDSGNSILSTFEGWKQWYGIGGKIDGNFINAAHWLNREQTKILFRKTKPNGETSQFIREYNYKTYPSPSKVTDVTWKESVATQTGELWSGNVDLAMSPNSKYLFIPGVVGVSNVYNLETLAEYTLPLTFGQYPTIETAWADDTHVVITMRPDRIGGPDRLNEQTIITAETQGTYILDLETKQMKRLTPYLIQDYGQNFVRLLNAKTILFVANNYVFKCNSDGSELIQVTKIPGVYSLAGAFIK